MRKIVSASAAACLLAAALVCVPALVHAAPPAKASTGTLVVVFKDGHRQTFNLADIERIEFPAAAAAAEPVPAKPLTPRGRYIGKWEVGDGAGNTFEITLDENGRAHRSIGDVNGRWEYVDGDALITWDDGWHDAIRRVDNHFQKFAYAAGKKFTDKPDNVAEAHTASPRPI